MKEEEEDDDSPAELKGVGLFADPSSHRRWRWRWRSNGN